MTDLAWTSKENIAIELIFELIGETRINRTLQEYCEIEKQLPTIEAAFVHVNSRLAQLAKSGRAPYEICYFKKGDVGRSGGHKQIFRASSTAASAIAPPRSSRRRQ